MGKAVSISYIVANVRSLKGTIVCNVTARWIITRFTIGFMRSLDTSLAVLFIRIDETGKSPIPRLHIVRFYDRYTLEYRQVLFFRSGLARVYPREGI